MSDLLAKCDVCQSLIDEEDLFCANCGTEAPKQGAPKREDGSPDDTSRMATHNFECSGCGAAMSFDAKASGLACPFCASVDMVEQKDAKVLAPSRVVPFAIDQDTAVGIMRAWLGKGWLRPSDLSQRAAVVKMQPVYVPYWVFQAETHTHWTADTSKTPFGARGDWYPLSGEHRDTYSGLLVGASGALKPHETSRICPFDLAAGVKPEEVDLENVTTEQFSLPRKYARPLARGLVERLEAEACDAKYVPGRSRNVHANVRIGAMSSEPVLLPIYIMAYRYKDRLFRFLVNGQSGKSTGEAPTSWRKILMIVLIVVMAILLGLIGSAAFASTEGTSTVEQVPAYGVLGGTDTLPSRTLELCGVCSANVSVLRSNKRWTRGGLSLLRNTDGFCGHVTTKPNASSAKPSVPPALKPHETSRICPFDLAAGVEPEEVDLENVTTEQFSLPRKYARPLARGLVERLEAEACDAKYVPGRSRNVHANVRIGAMSSEPVLLPIYIMAYRYKDRLFRFLVNGQSGKSTGEAPTSWRKILMIALMVVMAILLGLIGSAAFASIEGTSTVEQSGSPGSRTWAAKRQEVFVGESFHRNLSRPADLQD